MKKNFLILFWVNKFNFQFVYRPQQLELTAVNEIILMENINVFQMNGFDFQFQQDGKFY